MTSLANEVSAMESEIEGLRSENVVQRQHIAVLEFENDSHRKTIDRLQSERDEAMSRCDSIKVLLDQTGAALVSGIQKFNGERREAQENRLGVGSKDDPPPRMLTSTAERAFG